MKITIRVILLLVAAFGIFCVYSVASLFIPRHGEAARVSDLQRAFSKAGPEIAAVFTNSLIQKFPFDGVIEWRLILFKDPMLSLDGQVDTNALPEFISANPGTEFLDSGTTMMFGTPHTNQYGAVIDGTFDSVSNRVHFLIH
jgi:hypothetical protein